MNRFNPGQVVATPGALAAFEASGESLLDYLQRHLAGDWGDVSDPDIYENEYALSHDLRLLFAATHPSPAKSAIFLKTPGTAAPIPDKALFRGCLPPALSALLYTRFF